jgi:hypothetical protein
MLLPAQPRVRVAPALLLATPRPVRSPADPRRRPSTLPSTHSSGRVRSPRSGMPQPVHNSPRRRPPRYNGDSLGSAGLPQIRPSAATMCFGAGSSGALRVPGPARRVCSSCADSLHARACSTPPVAWPTAGRSRLSVLCSAASLMMSP